MPARPDPASPAVPRQALPGTSRPFGAWWAAGFALLAAAGLIGWALPPLLAVWLPQGLSNTSAAWAGLTAAALLLALALWLARSQPSSATAPSNAATRAGEPRPLMAAPAAAASEPALTTPGALGPAGSISPLGWQIDLLQRLPGVSLLLQPGGGDWVVIGVHRGTDAAPPDPAWSDLPAGLSHERLQPLTQLLTAHPSWPAAALRAGLTASTPEATSGGAPPAQRLPLADGACILWLAPQPGTSAATPPLEERESIAYSVSHDLRAPIRVIEGFTRIVREDYGAVLDRVGNDHLDRVLGAAARMNGMIDALLALSRLSTQPLAREQVPLSQLAQRIAQELQQQAPQRQVDFTIEPGLLARGDPTLLNSVLENLLGNAWKYSARRERAHIAFRRVERLLPGEVGSASPRPVYEVSDDGAGFDMRFAQRLFSPFQRLHSASEFAGNGVGLASVRRIVQRHGGQIWAESEVDRGARFYFTLG